VLSFLSSWSFSINNQIGFVVRQSSEPSFPAKCLNQVVHSFDNVEAQAKNQEAQLENLAPNPLPRIGLGTYAHDPWRPMQWQQAAAFRLFPRVIVAPQLFLQEQVKFRTRKVREDRLSSVVVGP
jgi:hypothetical protein